MVILKNVTRENGTISADIYQTLNECCAHITIDADGKILEYKEYSETYEGSKYYAKIRLMELIHQETVPEITNVFWY